MGLSRQVAIVAAGRVASTASIFAVNALLARAWTLDSFGRFSAIWILGNTLVPVFLLGIPAALLYALPRRASAEDRRQLVWQASAVLLGSATALGLLLWVVGAPLAGWLGAREAPAAVAELVVPFLPYIFSLVAAGHVEAALVASGRATWQAWLSLAGAVALVIVAGAARAQGWDVATTLAVLSLVGVLRCLAALTALAVATGGPRFGSTRDLPAFLGYAASIGLNDAVGSLSRAVDRVVVLVLLGATDLGLYHVGAIEVPVSLVLAAVVTVLVPEVSRLTASGRVDEVARLFRAAVGRLALFILPLFFYLFAFAEPLIAVYLPASFDRTDEVFRIFLLALPLRCAVYNPILVGSGKARWALYGALGDLVVNAGLSVALVYWLRSAHPGWALLGPAAATVAATWAQVVVLVAMLARLLRQPWVQVLPWARLTRGAITSATAAIVSAWLARELTGEPLWQLLIGGAAFTTLAAVGLRAWQADDWQELRQLARSLGRSGAAT